MGFTKQDVEFLEEHVENTLKDGCKYCSFRYIMFSTHVTKEPDGTKVFFLDVECPDCNAKYKDIMAMRNDND